MPTEAILQRVIGVEEDIRELKANKASNDRVNGLETRLDRIDSRLQALNTALLTGAIAWLVGSGMFLIAVLQLGSH